MKKFSERTTTEKSFIIVIIILIIGIVLRWGFIKKEIKRGFNYFSSDTTKVENVQK